MGDVELRVDQVADLAFLMANPRAGLLNDPGTGKTPTVCVLQWWLWSEHRAGTVWIMPKSLLGKNRRELLRFTPFAAEDVAIVDGAPARCAKALASGAKVFLMGFDRFKLCWRDLPAYVQAVHVDEWHKGFKGHESARTQALYECMERMNWFVPMTGTLISGSLESCYPAIHIIEPRYYPSFEAFKNFHSVRDEYDRAILWRNHDKLAAIFGRHCIRRTFRDIFGDQEVVYVPEVCTMSERHRAHYDKFKADAYLDLERFIVDGTLPGVGFIRGRQIQEIPNEFPDLTDVNDKGELVPNYRTVDIIPGALPDKEERFLIHLEDHVRTGRPFVAFAALRRQQKRLLSHIQDAGVAVGLLDSATSARQRDAIDQAFQAGRLQALVCSPQIADVGFNWQFWRGQEVDHAMLVSADFLDTSITQLVRRFIRGRRETPMRLTVFEYEDSLDQRIFEIIFRKSVEANKVDPTREVIRLGAAANAWRPEEVEAGSPLRFSG